MSVAPAPFLIDLTPVTPPRSRSAKNPARSRNADRPRAETLPLIAFCHLSWNGVWQRPQQLLSRLSAQRPVLFVEAYAADVVTARSHVIEPPACPGVTVLSMHLPRSRWDETDFIDLERRRLLIEFLGGTSRFDEPVLWFNDPMTVSAFAGQCGEAAIVYDCMDELSQFKGAPPQLVAREQQLVRLADVIFCGGRKMRDKRLASNPNCHFYGTGVDSAHFGRARSPSLPVPADLAAIPGRVFGYFGVIDERIDYELLARLADALPHCSIAMVGPTAKVDPAGFPQRSNLRWLGRRDYADLPAVTKRFDACLMPFARNAATEYINPTKALEYMAAGRPIVSTAIDEVRSNFGDVCLVAGSHDEFIAHCRQAVESPDLGRIARGIELASRSTWERITGEMDAHILAAVRTRRRSHV